VKPAEILHSLKAQYRKEALSHARVYNWYNKFSEGCKEVQVMAHN
jgi:hypothetical protein